MYIVQYIYNTVQFILNLRH